MTVLKKKISQANLINFSLSWNKYLPNMNDKIQESGVKSLEKILNERSNSRERNTVDSR